MLYVYPKSYLSPADLVTHLISKGMIINSQLDAENAIKKIGYYHLKGYFFDLIDSTTGQYIPGTNFDNILKIYDFDIRLSNLLFDYLLKIEISLRARLIEVLRVYNDPFIIFDPAIFNKKDFFWKNLENISSEINRSKDHAFILHNFSVHNGYLPIWVVVEEMQYGTLSKTIKNLVTGVGSAASNLLLQYRYTNQNGNLVTPSMDMFSSWIQASNSMRNICAHNGRIYNRRITTIPRLINADQLSDSTGISYGVYHQILAMKYLSPDTNSWSNFVFQLKQLINSYSSVINISKLYFPTDWANHIK